MQWRAEFSKSGERDLRRLERTVRRDVIDRLGWLVANFDSITPRSLHGSLKGFFKLRAGDWRIVYSFDQGEKLITVYAVDHRRDVYK